MINDIEDNYPEYLNDTLGYEWDAWDNLTQAEIADHDKILEGDAPENYALKDLGIWAHCRYLLLGGNLEAFIEYGRTLFDSENKKSSALIYPEIAALICNTMSKSEDEYDIEGFLSTRRKEAPENAELLVAEYIFKATKNENLESEFKEIKEVELLFDITEGLLSAGFVPLAKKCFAECKTKVGNQPLSAIHVDLEAMGRRLACL